MNNPSVPDLIPIRLGTNDFSDGNGGYRRARLVSAEFVDRYIRFIQTLRDRYAKTQIRFLKNPIPSPEKYAKNGTNRVISASTHRGNARRPDRIQ